MNDFIFFETGCCKRFYPEEWQDKEIIFNDKLYQKDHVRSLFRIPLQYENVMERDRSMLEKSGTKNESSSLIEEKSMWKSEELVPLNKEVKDAELNRNSGRFLSLVYEDSFKDIDKYIRDMDLQLIRKGLDAEELFFYHTYCHKCSLEYGKNYTVVLAKINESPI